VDGVDGAERSKSRFEAPSSSAAGIVTGKLDTAGDVIGSLGFSGQMTLGGIAGVIGATMGARFAGQETVLWFVGL
jgi:hypothetical protein